MSPSGSTCQIENQDEFSLRRRPTFLYAPGGIVTRLRRQTTLVSAVRRALREHGPLYTVRKSAAVTVASLRRWLGEREQQPSRKTPACEGAILGLRAGELVEIRPIDEIRSTLDSNGKHHGLAFTAEMRNHCGRRYRVYKRVEGLHNEFSGEQRKVRNTVLLEGVFCQGEGFGCDRSCFHLWREAWLRRVPHSSHDTASN